jgi:hypothetical protein
MRWPKGDIQHGMPDIVISDLGATQRIDNLRCITGTPRYCGLKIEDLWRTLDDDYQGFLVVMRSPGRTTPASDVLSAQQSIFKLCFNYVHAVGCDPYNFPAILSEHYGGLVSTSGTHVCALARLGRIYRRCCSGVFDLTHSRVLRSRILTS